MTATLHAQETEALNNTILYEDYRSYTAYTRYTLSVMKSKQVLPQITDETEVEVLDRQMREAWDAAESLRWPQGST